MEYDFSDFFNEDNNTILNEFLDIYTLYLDSIDDSCSILTGHYQNIINILNHKFTLEDILKKFENLAKHEILLENPYVIITNEIYCLKNLLVSKMAESNSNASIIEFISVFDKVNNTIARVYLQNYIEKLLSLNTIRINSLSDLVNRKIIKHYEAHLNWLTELAISIRDKNLDNYPELDSCQCSFGKWLSNDGKYIVQNNSKYKTIEKLHTNLHLFAKKAQRYTLDDEYHILITYLEKCEMLSLSIGTELALVDNIIMNKKVTKDALTGAMNRHALGTMFESQYEISLATGNSFMLALCDLDLFKKVNDKYGHVVGDKVLELFVHTVKRCTRDADIIIRYGGEEFIIIIPAIDKNVGFKILENIRKEFKNSFLLDNDIKIITTVSIGAINIKPIEYYDDETLNTYIDMADKKLYKAKATGRDKVQI